MFVYGVLIPIIWGFGCCGSSVLVVFILGFVPQSHESHRYGVAVDVMVVLLMSFASDLVLFCFWTY